MCMSGTKKIKTGLTDHGEEQTFPFATSLTLSLTLRSTVSRDTLFFVFSKVFGSESSLVTRTARTMSKLDVLSRESKLGYADYLA